MVFGKFGTKMVRDMLNLDIESERSLTIVASCRCMVDAFRGCALPRLSS